MVYIIFSTDLHNSNKSDVYYWDENHRVRLLDLVVPQISISSKSQYATRIIYKGEFVDDFHIFYNKPPPRE